VHLVKPDEGISGSVAVDLAATQGNSRRTDHAAGMQLHWLHGLQQNILLIDYAYGAASGVTNTDNGFTHLRHIQNLGNDWAAEAYLQASRNSLSRLKFRGLAGGGGRKQLLPAMQGVTLFAGIGAFFARERLQADGATTRTLSEDWWGNVYFIVKLQLTPRLELSNSLYYQPRAADSADYRLSDRLLLSVPITESVKVTLSMALDHDSRPPAAVKRTDLSYKSALVLRF